ncbi:MAG: DNA primase [Phycisphaerae bacterium]|nr:DNA primase [Phycisphaerae bacterium]
MARYDDAILRQVQQAIDIVELIGERVSLKQSGKDLKGLCPFHADKNPSMYVSPSKQIFKCFACGAGGDVFKYIQLADRVEFPEAVRILAGRANIELPEPGRGGEGPTGPNKSALAEVNKWAARKFRSWMLEPAGEAARKYYGRRGFTEQTIQRFGLGYAPPGWDNLIAAARKDRIELPLLVAAGLAHQSQKPGHEGSHYDAFRDRVMFPIMDASERVIGFGGRTLGDDTPKYLNTAETPLFNKRRELYGLRWGRHAVTATETVVIVEGYTDVIMAHQAGFENVVATLGTALTDDHVRILGRLAKRIVLIYDADEAGIKASDRALELFLAAGVDLAIGMMPEGLDPCDAIVAGGPKVFADAVAAAIDALEFKWQTVSRQFAAADGTADRRAAVEAMITTLAGMAGYANLDPIRRGLMLDRLATLSGASGEELNRLLSRQVQRRRPTPAAPEGPSQAQTPDRESRAIDIALAQILGVLLAEPSYYHSIRQSIGPTDFVDPNVRALAEPVFELGRGGELSLTALLRKVESPQLANLATDLAERVTRMGVSKVFEGAVAEVERHRHLTTTQELVAPARSRKLTDDELRSLAKKPRDPRNPSPF